MSQPTVARPSGAAPIDTPDGPDYALVSEPGNCRCVSRLEVAKDMGVDVVVTKDPRFLVGSTHVATCAGCGLLWGVL